MSDRAQLAGRPRTELVMATVGVVAISALAAILVPGLGGLVALGGLLVARYVIARDDATRRSWLIRAASIVCLGLAALSIVLIAVLLAPTTDEEALMWESFHNLAGWVPV